MQETETAALTGGGVGTGLQGHGFHTDAYGQDGMAGWHSRTGSRKSAGRHRGGDRGCPGPKPAIPLAERHPLTRAASSKSLFKILSTHIFPNPLPASLFSGEFITIC